MSEWLMVLVATTQTLVGVYIGYTIGDHHGWKRCWKDVVERGKQSKDEDVSG